MCSIHKVPRNRGLLSYRSSNVLPGGRRRRGRSPEAHAAQEGAYSSARMRALVEARLLVPTSGAKSQEPDPLRGAYSSAPGGPVTPWSAYHFLSHRSAARNSSFPDFSRGSIFASASSSDRLRPASSSHNLP